MRGSVLQSPTKRKLREFEEKTGRLEENWHYLPHQGFEGKWMGLDIQADDYGREPGRKPVWLLRHSHSTMSDWDLATDIKEVIQKCGGAMARAAAPWHDCVERDRARPQDAQIHRLAHHGVRPRAQAGPQGALPP